MYWRDERAYQCWQSRAVLLCENSCTESHCLITLHLCTCNALLPKFCTEMNVTASCCFPLVWFAWSCLFASARVMRVARRLPFSSTVQCILLQTKALPSGTMGDLVKLRIWEQQARATPHHPPYLLPFMSPPGLPQYRTEKKELNLS